MRIYLWNKSEKELKNSQLDPLTRSEEMTKDQNIF